MQDDYVLPGCPLDTYLQSLDNDSFGNVEDLGNNDDRTEEHVPTFQRVLSFLRQFFSATGAHIFDFHERLTRMPSAENDGLQLDYDSQGLEIAARLLTADHRENIEELIYVRRKKNKVETRQQLFDISITAPLVLAHIIWIVNFELTRFIINVPKLYFLAHADYCFGSPT